MQVYILTNGYVKLFPATRVGKLPPRTVIIKEDEHYYLEDGLLKDFKDLKELENINSNSSNFILNAIQNNFLETAKTSLGFTVVVKATEKPIEAITLRTPRAFLVRYSVPSKNLFRTQVQKRNEDQIVSIELIPTINSYFINRIVYLSARFYQTLDKYAVNTKIGYIIPHEFIGRFLEEVKELEMMYRKLDVDLEDFIKHGKVPPNIGKAKIDLEYMNAVKRYLKKYGKRLTTPKIAPRFNYYITSINLGYTDAAKTHESEIPIVELRKTEKHIVEQIINAIVERAEHISSKLEEFKTKRLNNKALNALQRNIEYIAVFVNQLRGPVLKIKALETLVNKMEEICQGRSEIKLGRKSKQTLRSLTKKLVDAVESSQNVSTTSDLPSRE